MTTVTACRVSVHGVVQGVGFRPFVYQLATHFGLTGTVRNTLQSGEIEVEGSASAIKAFLEALVVEVPPLAHIDDVEVVESESHGAYAVDLSAGEPIVIDPAPVIRGIVRDLQRGVAVPIMASRFHASVTVMILRVCERLRSRTSLGRVVLSGGVFENVTLLAGARRVLQAAGFEVFNHHRVPPNDGGLALGQAVVAHARLG